MSVIRWLLEDLICMIVKSRFYATDTSKTNSEIFYYLKSDWIRVLRMQLKDPVTMPYRNLYNLEKISKQDAVGYCSRNESHGMFLGEKI